MWIFPIELLFFPPSPHPLSPPPPPRWTFADCYAPRRLRRLLALRIDDLWKRGSNTRTISGLFLERPFAPISNGNLIRRLLHRSVESFQIVKLSSNLCLLSLFTYWRCTREWNWEYFGALNPNNLFGTHFHEKNCMNSSQLILTSK